MKKKVVLITNIPAPYRVLFFDEIARSIGENFTVLYCAKNESNRSWKIPNINHKHIFLKNTMIKIGKSRVYFNYDVWKYLKELNPDIIITGGFAPTMLLSILFARLKRRKHFITTDAWEKTEKNLSFIHKFVRKIFYVRADALLPVSKKGKQNFKRYGIEDEKIFICPYAIYNEMYGISDIKKKYDLMFSGQFIHRKMPFFFIAIVKEVLKFYPTLQVLILGNGPLKKEFLERLDILKVKYNYPGFVQQDELPRYYNESKIFLFPTEKDAWGVVANEACAAGVPVISCENAGASGDLIMHNYNGYILPLKVDVWTNHILELLKNREIYKKFSENCIKQINDFTIKKSAVNFLKAIEFVSQY